MERTTITGLVGIAAAIWVGAAAGAAELQMPPEATTITFELDSTLHTVHGSAQLTEGSLRFEPAGGAASGRIVIDATSLDTDNGLRDGQMHAKVLESERFPRIEFVPESLEVEDRRDQSARVVLVGRMKIHGGEWPMRIPAAVEAKGEDLRIEGTFVVPYVEWGMTDMSNFLLSVDPEVVVHFETLASVEPALVAGGPTTGASR